MYKAQKKDLFFQLILLLFGFANLYASSNNDDSSFVPSAENLKELDWTQGYELLKNNPFQERNNDNLFIEVVEAEEFEEEVEDSILNFQNIGTTGLHVQRLETISCKRKENTQYIMRCSGCVCLRLYLKHQVFLI